MAEQATDIEGMESERPDPLEIPDLLPGCMAARKPYVAAS